MGTVVWRHRRFHPHTWVIDKDGMFRERIGFWPLRYERTRQSLTKASQATIFWREWSSVLGVPWVSDGVLLAWSNRVHLWLEFPDDTYVMIKFPIVDGHGRPRLVRELSEAVGRFTPNVQIVDPDAQPDVAT